MKKLFRDKSILETIVITIAIVVIGLTLKPFALKIANSFDKLDELLGTSINNVQTMATTTAPAVNNGGSSSSSGGGNTIKKIQYVTMSCGVFYQDINNKSYTISVSDPSKVDIIVPEGVSIAYSITNTSFITSYTSSYYSNTHSSMMYYHCGIATYSAENAGTLLNRTTVKLIEYY